MATHESVTFLSATGETISNDPVWLAEKTLASAGVEIDKSAGSDELREELDAKDRELQALRAQLAAKETEELEDEDEPTGNYSDVKGKDLTALAKERNISLKNDDGSAKKAGEVRAELIAQDEANKAK